MKDLYYENREQLIRIAFNIINDWELAADIIHDVFLKFIKHGESINSPKNWLIKCVVNHSLDKKKSQEKLKITSHSYTAIGDRYRAAAASKAAAVARLKKFKELSESPNIQTSNSQHNMNVIPDPMHSNQQEKKKSKRKELIVSLVTFPAIIGLVITFFIFKF